MSIEHAAIGRQMRIAREQTYLSQTEAAHRMNMSQAKLSYIESGKQRLRVEELLRFQELYGVKLFSTRPPSLRRRVLSHIFRRAPYESEALGADLLHMSSQQLERIAATIISMLVAREREEEAQS